MIASEAGDVAATKRLVENVKATRGRIVVLFVNPGISRFKPMIDEAFFDTYSASTSVGPMTDGNRRYGPEHRRGRLYPDRQ